MNSTRSSNIVTVKTKPNILENILVSINKGRNKNQVRNYNYSNPSVNSKSIRNYNNSNSSINSKSIRNYGNPNTPKSSPPVTNNVSRSRAVVNSKK